MLARVLARGQDVSFVLVRAGLAWHYKRYSADAVLAEAEVEARKAKVGLWSMLNPVPPWGYRKVHRSEGISPLFGMSLTLPRPANYPPCFPWRM